MVALRASEVQRLLQEYPLYFKSTHGYDYSKIETDIFLDSKNKGVEKLYRTELLPLLSRIRDLAWSDLWRNVNACMNHVMYFQIMRNESYLDLVYSRQMTLAALMVALISLTGISAMLPVIQYVGEKQGNPEFLVLVKDMYKQTAYKGCKAVPSEEDHEQERQDKLHEFFQKQQQQREDTRRIRESMQLEEHILTYPYGERYEGGAKLDIHGILRPSGKGVLYYPDGKRFEGFFDDRGVYGTMNNLKIQGSIDQLFQFTPYIQKPLNLGIVFNSTTYETITRTNPTLLAFLETVKERTNRFDVGIISDWIKLQVRKNRFPDNLCRGMLEGYTRHLMEENNCDMVCYAYDDKKQINGIIVVKLHIAPLSETDPFINIKAFCAKENTSRIGSILMNVMKSMVVSYQENLRYTAPLAITLESINHLPTVSFYQNMSFVEDNGRRETMNPLEAHLIPMIWHSSQSEIPFLVSLWESLREKKHTYMKKCEGSRRRSRSHGRSKTRRSRSMHKKRW